LIIVNKTPNHMRIAMSLEQVDYVAQNRP